MVHDGLVKPVPAVAHGAVLSYVQNVPVVVVQTAALPGPCVQVPRWLVPLLRFLRVKVLQ